MTGSLIAGLRFTLRIRDGSAEEVQYIRFFDNPYSLELIFRRARGNAHIPIAHKGTRYDKAKHWLKSRQPSAE